MTEIVIMREKDTDRPRGFGFAVFESVDTVENVCQKRYIKIKVSVFYQPREIT